MRIQIAVAVFVLVFLLPNVLRAERPSITSLQQQINQLNARINDLEAQSPTPVRKVFTGTTLLGYAQTDTFTQAGNVELYEPKSKYFYTMQIDTDSGVSTLHMQKTHDVFYGSFDCTGQGMIINQGYSDTRNLLISVGSDFYKTIGIADEARPVVVNSSIDKQTGNCGPASSPGDNSGIALVEKIAYPLPYSLPIAPLAPFDLRIEYEAP